MTEDLTALSTRAARNLATTTKSVPQMQAITPRWLLRSLPWVRVGGGTYRVNRRLTYQLGDGRVSFVNDGTDVRVIPAELAELPPLRGLTDGTGVLSGIAERLVQREYEPGDVLVSEGDPLDQIVLIAHGKVERIGTGEYGDPAVLGVLDGGGFIGAPALLSDPGEWEFSVRATTPVTALVLGRSDIAELTRRSDELRAHLEVYESTPPPPHNKAGEAAIDMSAGHDGEPLLPGTFVDYESAPREYQLSVAQTRLRIHTRVADLYNEPMNQVEQQVRLTVEALLERQEHDLLNNPDYGLLHNADLRQRVYTRTGPPTPDDMDDLLARRRKSRLFLAHPRTIAAFGRECSRRGVYPATIVHEGARVMSWRGVPILPTDKIAISPRGTSSILCMRTGEDDEGVIGLHRTGLADEIRPGLSVRFMGVDDKAVMSYLVTAYHSAAVLVPDALGVLEQVEVGR